MRELYAENLNRAIIPKNFGAASAKTMCRVLKKLGDAKMKRTCPIRKVLWESVDARGQEMKNKCFCLFLFAFSVTLLEVGVARHNVRPLTEVLVKKT